MDPYARAAGVNEADWLVFKKGEYEIRVEGYTAELCTQIVPDEYAFSNSGFEIKHYDRPVVTGHGMTFIKLVPAEN